MGLSGKMFIDNVFRALGSLPRGLRPKMAFYAEHFMELRDGLIVQPPYIL
jgi:hypothetical protein